MEDYFVFLFVMFCGKCFAGIHISSCGDGTIAFLETDPVELSCTGFNNGKMYWAITPPDGIEKTISSCTWWPAPSRCTERVDGWLATREQIDKSSLKRSHENNIGGTLRCGEYGPNAKSVECKVQVISLPNAPPEIIPENKVLTEGENRILSCQVTGGDPPVDRVTFSCGMERPDTSDTSITVDGTIWLISNVTFAPVTAKDNELHCRCYASWSNVPTLTAQEVQFTLTVGAKPEEQKLPVVAIAAGAGALLVVVAIVVTVIVVVVVVKRRKNSHGHDGTKARKREDAEEYQHGRHANTASNNFEEGAEDETSLNYASVSPAGATQTNQQSQYNNIGGNLYSTAEEAEEENPTRAASPAVQMQDEYAVVNKPAAQGKQEHQADVYAVVQKTDKHQDAGEPQAAADEYAVVQKTKPPTSAEPQADVYAVVQKSK